MDGENSTIINILIVTVLLAFLFNGFTAILIMEHGRRIEALERQVALIDSDK